MRWAARNFFKNKSFGTQLSLAIGLGVLFLVLILTMASSYLLADQMRTRMIAESKSLAEQLARDHVFVFLTKDKASSQSLITKVTAFPQITMVTLYDEEGIAFAPITKTTNENTRVTSLPLSESITVSETKNDWRFLAPVIESSSSSPFDSDAPPLRLGYFEIQIDKDEYLSAVQSIWISNFLLGFSGAIAFLIWVSTRIKRLTLPLEKLAAHISATDASNPNPASITKGPTEVHEIAAVYNELIDTISKHQNSLSREISIRTEELKAARDAALDALRHKEAFTAALTHEMRSPIQSLSGYAQLSLQRLETELDQDAAEEIRSNLGVIIKKSNDLLAVINQILILATAAAGKIDIQLSQINIADLLEEAVETVRPLATAQGNILSQNHEGKALAYVDRDKFFQISLNLLTNAIKFTKDGKISVVSICDSDGLVMTIADTGIGIAPDDHELIFEPYRQLNTGRTQTASGTGLGLAITKEFCRLQNGEIKVCSALGEGAKFTVLIPAHEGGT